MELSLILTLKLTITLILTLFNCLMLVFEHRPMIFKLASFVRFSHRSNTVLLPMLLLPEVFTGNLYTDTLLH